MNSSTVKWLPKWIGNATGLTMIFVSGGRAINDYRNGNWISGTWNLAKAAGQGVILWGGGEDPELLWNTGTFAVDAISNLFKSK